MSYQVLARKWRPAQFDQVVGQKHIVAALSNALDQDRVHHAFLFTGTRGVGKTTLARIFAKALNCEQGVSSTPCGECSACVAVSEGRFIDLIEVDAASRTKVDDTRELLDNVQYAPTQGRYKIYLIDEVHMLSTHSFNALLKTLEEPPEHVKFLLATTDPQKLPMTVLSRCIQFSLNAIEPQAIEKQLSMILESEGITFEPAALTILARAADGSLRDALSLLDQAIAYSNQQLTESSIRQMLGLIDGQSIVGILKALADNNIDELMAIAAQLVHAAQDLQTALDDLLSYLHALALFQFAPEAIEWKGLNQAQVAELAEIYAPETIQLYYQIVLNGKRDFSFAPDPRTGFEMVLLRLAAFKPGAPSEKPASQAKAPEAKSKAAEPAKPALKEDQDKTGKTESAEILVPEQAVDPVLDDGLQNKELLARIQPASSLVPKTPVDEPKAPIADAEPPVVEESIAPYDSVNKTNDINEIVGNINVWSDFIVKAGLTGMARQLTMHMTPLSFEDGVLKLQLDQQYENLQSAERMQQIEDTLQHASAQQFKLQVELGEVLQAQTAAGVIAERERSNLEKTRQDFKDDENVQELISQFGAEIDDGSIKPIN